MENRSNIGLDPAKSGELAEQLNLLLANYQLFYINARGFHWNITGSNFFELHAKFEELYNNLLVKVDEIAERILTLGHVPLHSFADYLNTATIQQAVNISDGKEAIQNVVNAFRDLLVVQRRLLSLASDTNDEGTSALMSDYIREQEKAVWMYSAYLK